jgi:uncharacterized protein (TIGR03382 family)
MDPQVLLIDDHNGPLPAIPIAVEFQADFQITYIASVPLGGAFIHNYSLNGTFSFVDGRGNTILSATVTNGALTAIGGALSWYSTSTIQATDGNANQNNSVVYTWNGGDMPGYDLLNGVSFGPDDMAFTLTSLNASAMDVVLDPATHLPVTEWNSEGSYSGTSHFIPAPGAAMILGLGGLVATRRRRR